MSDLLLVVITEGGIDQGRKNRKRGAMPGWVRADKTPGFCLMARV